ncbi:rho-related GTP-binding protein RhoF [Triplophysa dalaica]|uniref:rho-related GTP-binding protein RhoF n=1 Tax=Triplophysa dalaica TaxID=1582913 RepID=UPI0024DF70A7|nr:rho-related GTP-binding protein RhoF [Triplophysa dalaica]
MTENRTIASNGTQIDELKIVVVGDGGCGKTSLLMVYAKGDFPEKYAPSVFDKYVTTVNHGGKDIQLNLYDTAGQEDYDRLRPLSYQDVNLVLICYDVTNPTSFENVTIKWFPEVHHFCHDTPIILIGCKTDLRNNKEKMRKLKASDMAPITYLQGEEIQKQLKAEVYLECSAKYRENVEDIFRETAKRALAARAKAKHARKKKKHCSIL